MFYKHTHIHEQKSERERLVAGEGSEKKKRNQARIANGKKVCGEGVSQCIFTLRMHHRLL